MRLLLLLLASFVAFEGYAQSGWTVEGERTVALDIREQVGVQGHARLRKVTEYHGRYYCMFTFSGGLFSRRDGELLFAVDTRTLEAVQLPCPKEFGHYKDDLFVRHDTLFLDIYGSWEKHDFWFDTADVQWVECPELVEQVYEDDDVGVYEVDNGEWGQSMWFHDRRGNKECALVGLGAVRRAGGRFFVVEPDMVRSVTFSQIDTATPSMTNHRQAKADYFAAGRDKSLWLRADTLYVDPRYEGWLSYIGQYHDTVIVGSVVVGDSLVLLVDRPDSTVLMRISGRNELQTIVALGRRYGVDVQTLSVCGNIRTNRLVVPFQQDALNAGLIDVGEGKVNVLNISLVIDTLPICAADGLDTLLAFLEAGWGSIDDSMAIAFERAHGGVFLEEDSLRNGYFKDIGLTDANSRNLRMRKRVDTLYNMSIEYCVRRNDRRVAALFFDFYQPQHYMSWGTKPRRDWNHNEREEREAWEARQAAAMITRLDALCGPHHVTVKQRWRWKRGKMTLIFYPDRNRLMIF